jgi:membrane protein
MSSQPSQNDPAAIWWQRAQEAFSFCRYVVRRFIDDGCQQNAAALTYMSLFAIVPLMTVGFAMFSAVPAFESMGSKVQSFIFEHFVPSTGSEVQTYLESFSQQARSLTGFGVAFLAATAYLMLRNIEKTFNKIWRTRTHRKGLNNFLLYWAILTLGPVMLGASLVMTTYLAVFVKDIDVVGIMPLVLKYLPWLFTSITFTLLFMAVPNCKVPLRHAAIGGFVTAALFELAKNLFASLVANSSYELVYGTFATIPLFLFWLYFSWLLLLGGAELVRALSSYRSRFAEDYPDLIVATLVLQRFWKAQQHGQAIDEISILEDDWLFGRDINREQWERLRNILLQGKLLAVTESGDFVLNRDLHQLTLWDLQLLINRNLKTLYNDSNLVRLQQRSKASPEWHADLQKLVQQLASSHRELFALSLADLFTQNSTSELENKSQQTS